LILSIQPFIEQPLLNKMTLEFLPKELEDIITDYKIHLEDVDVVRTIQK